MRKDCNMLKIILEEGFCPTKTEIARFPLGFCLKNYCRINQWLDLNKMTLFYAQFKGKFSGDVIKF